MSSSSDEYALESFHIITSVMSHSESFCFIAILVHFNAIHLSTKQNQQYVKNF